MDTDQLCRFCLIPNELKLNVLIYLETIDIIKISTALSCNCMEQVTFEKYLVKEISLAREYDLKFSLLREFINPRRDIITYLNINCMYWIPRGLLIGCITLLKSLKCLNALDTKLGYEDIFDLQKKTELERIAVSCYKIPHKWGLDSSNYKAIHVYVHCDNIDYYNFNNIMRNNPEIEMKVHYLTHKTPMKVPTPVTELMQNSQHHNISIVEFDSQINKDAIIRHFGYRLFAPSRFGRKSFLQYDDWDNLNIAHSPNIPICRTPFLNHYVKTVFRSRVLQHLKILSINYCLIDIPNDCTGGTCAPHCDSFNFKEFLSYYADLVELHIWACLRSYDANILNESLMEITKLKRLKTLSLDTFNFLVSGSFFRPIMESCANLQTLKVKFHDYLPVLKSFYDSLKYTKQLKNLRLEVTHGIHFGDFLTALTNSPCKLERLVVRCKSVRTVQMKQLDRYLQTNPQLKFLFIVISEVSERVCAEMMRLLRGYSQGDGQKLYKVNKTFELKIRGGLIPAVHVLEMVNFGWQTTEDSFERLTFKH